MRPSPNHAAWQAGPVGTIGRIVAVTLIALTVDSTFLWRFAPYRVVTLAMTVVSALVAIRVVRALPRSLHLAALTFAATLLLSMAMLTTDSQPFASQLAGVLVAAVVSAFGLAALTIGWNRERRPKPAAVAITRSSEHSVAVIRRR